MIGTLLDGKYEIQQLLGQGGMGAVYAARHTGTDRRLAVKVIQHGDVSKQSSLVVRLQREARAAGAIDSPHIGQVVDTGTDPATSMPYLVMELLEGEDLQQLLHRTGPLRPDVGLRIVAQAALGLAKAHEARVVHRDIKPANLFLARQPDGQVLVKVLDFGIAKLKHEELGAMESGSLTRTGSVLGSPLYMSPEQARGHKSIDHRADVWSLGVVAYQVLTGRTPYQEIDALGELILAICSELPPCVQDFAPWVDPEVAETVHRALSLHVGERFQTAMEMHDALAAHLSEDAQGRPDLRLHTSSFVSVTDDARSITAPRLITEVGRRPAHTGQPTSRHVITPAPAERSLAGDTGDRRSSPQEIEAGPTLMIEPGNHSGERLASAARTPARAGLPADAVPQGTIPPGTGAGVSRSSPAAPPPRRFGAFAAGAVVAAVVTGVGVAFLMHGAVGATATTQAAPLPSLATPPSAPAEVAPSATVDAAHPSVAPQAPGAVPPAPSTSTPASAPSASPPNTKPTGALPPRPATSGSTPAKPSSSPPAGAPSKPLDNSGFGDRK